MLFNASQSLAAVQSRIAAAAAAAGRAPDAISLLAVSKTHPPEAVKAFYDLGLRAFGENYAQELSTKARALAALPGLRWSFIGTVQSNKIKMIVEAADEIQSVASLDHAKKIAAAAHASNKVPFSIYLAVNAADEASKHGVALGGAKALADEIAAACPELAIQGVMAIPPPLPDGTTGVPPLYARLAALATKIGAGRLSLGMTGDLEPAIAAGSTCVRIGTALFGSREARKAP